MKQKEAPKEDVERMILESGGVKSLIGCLHGISEIHKAKKQLQNGSSNVNNIVSENTPAVEVRRACPVPDRSANWSLIADSKLCLMID
ncbi:hypothetical protein SSX86_005566 [Deinandra increscens subsp. villosa]|uniref:Uncharacterized protein n=1 Tax=Deinandra increscens subsp. villosa TaxID=3103831 RepID=A0AAP0DU67_9ASTR